MIYSIHFKRYLKLPLHSAWYTLELMFTTFLAPSHCFWWSSHLRLETTKWLKTLATWLSLTLKMLWIITLHQRLCLDWTTFQLKCQENMQCIFRPKYRCFHQKFVGFSCFQRMLFKVLFDSETTLNLTLWSKYIFCIHLTTISCPIFKIDFYRCKCFKDFI